MNILIAGATGLVGNAITDLCKERGYFVHYLTTNKTKIKSTSILKGFYWDPKTQEIDTNCLNGIDAIINLAGASVSKRWSATYKKEIEDSRIDSVRLLHKLLSENEHKVQYFTSASAMGIYPSSYTNEYVESYDKINPTFLGNVVHQWEKEIDKIQALDIEVSKLRIGIVLSNKGGALLEMIKPIKLGFGAAIGNGQQQQSWIHIEDLAEMFLYVIEKKLLGTYNAVSSNPITNMEMTKAIARRLKKSLWLPNIPAFVMKLILGEMSAIVLESQNLNNSKILKKGFTFKYGTLEKALDNCLS